MLDRGCRRSAIPPTPSHPRRGPTCGWWRVVEVVTSRQHARLHTGAFRMLGVEVQRREQNLAVRVALLSGGVGYQPTSRGAPAWLGFHVCLVVCQVGFQLAEVQLGAMVGEALGRSGHRVQLPRPGHRILRSGWLATRGGGLPAYLSWSSGPAGVSRPPGGVSLGASFTVCQDGFPD